VWIVRGLVTLIRNEINGFVDWPTDYHFAVTVCRSNPSSPRGAKSHGTVFSRGARGSTERTASGS